MTNTETANRLEAAARRHHADLGRAFRQQAETLRAAVEMAQGYFPLPTPKRSIRLTLRNIIGVRA